jgi:hypothetical protein
MRRRHLLGGPPIAHPQLGVQLAGGVLDSVAVEDRVSAGIEQPLLRSGSLLEYINLGIIRSETDACHALDDCVAHARPLRDAREEDVEVGECRINGVTALA